jgi:putative ABC transport system permease protein
MDGIGQEVRQAIRRLLHSPAFTLATVLTLALAIGANASIFAVVHRVVLNPLPYPASHQLIELDHGALRLNAPAGLGLTPGIYFHYANRARTVDGLALYRADDQSVTGDGEPDRIRIVRATPSLASVLRVSPALGRWFSSEEGLPAARRVAVLSHGLWTRRYGRDRSVINRSMMLGGEPAEIIGVMPPAFAFPDPRVEMWVAEQIMPASGFGLWSYSGIARLREGVSLEDARTEFQALIPDLAMAYPNDLRAAGNVEGKLVFSGRTLKDATVGHVQRALLILLASVGLVLLVACANVANLFLVRSETRQREIAVRRALGAGRTRVARYFLMESTLLSLAGGAIGLALAWGALRLVVGFAPANLPRLTEIRLDPVAVAFTLLVSLIAAFIFGSIPLLRQTGFADSLHETGRNNTATRRRHHARHVLMGAQVAMALVLLVSSGLMVRSFQELRAMDVGFDGTSALTFSLGLPDRGYPTREAAVAAHHAMIDRLSALPGVTRVSATSCLPLAAACSGGNTVRVEGRSYTGTIPPIALFRAVADGYFDAMGIKVLRGRAIVRPDIDTKQPVVVVSASLARRFFPNQDPIGQRVASNRAPVKPGGDPQLQWLEIVGIVADTPTGRVLPGGPPMPQIYMPVSIAGGPGIPQSSLIGPDIAVMSYVLRTSTTPLDFVPAVRHAINAFDANLPLAQVRTMQDELDRATAQMAFTMALLSIAAAVALMLGLIGIYGVMSYIVSQRTGEIGVRLALGAEPRTVAGAIVRQGALVALAGIAVGLAAAIAGGRLIESLLYGVSSRDPGVLVAMTIALLGVAVVACWLPARRAARLSPIEALRTD